MDQSSLKQFAFQEFTANEICSILSSLLGDGVKISLPQLSYYVKKKFVRPDGVTFFRGKRKFSFKNLIILYWLFKLKQQGLAVNKFAQCIPQLERLSKSVKELLNMVLITDGDRVYLKDSSEVGKVVGKILNGKNKGQYVWLFGLSSLAEGLNNYWFNEKKAAP